MNNRMGSIKYLIFISKNKTLLHDENHINKKQR
jgi:hypothetical protein